MVAGCLIAVSAVAAQGTDLRPGRNTDLVSLVNSERQHNEDLVKQVSQSRAEVDALTAQRNKLPNVDNRLATAQQEAGMTDVSGPAVTVSLNDAPLDVNPAGLDQDLLVVHQQDIQAVANALWSGGAEAMTIQGVRVVATTGIKCVGNTVVLHGIPYAPPYVISAIGDTRRLQAALDASAYVTNYRAYADHFRLGYDVRVQQRVTMPGHQGRVDLEYAHEPTPSASPTR